MKLISITVFNSLAMLVAIANIAPLQSFTPSLSTPKQQYKRTLQMTITSPFDNTDESDSATTTTTTAAFTPLENTEETLDLTWENVDAVLEEMRPYLIQDGGNVAISEIDGPIVRLELQVRFRCIVYNVFMMHSICLYSSHLLYRVCNYLTAREHAAHAPPRHKQ